MNKSATDLSAAERQRYSRHLILPEVGETGQRRLKAGRVLLVGTGGLGSPAALYLTAAGVGHLTLIDPDHVDASNLQRQVLFGEPDLDRPKVEAARERLHGINPHIQLDTRQERLTRDNALELCRQHDLVVDGTDNFPTRYLVNDACVLTGTPNVHGSIFRFQGQASVYGATDGPCYRCLYPEPPPPHEVPSCADAGVLGILPGIIGTIQATEAIKLLLGEGAPLIGRLLTFDALAMRFRELTLHPDPDCPVCGETPTITELIDYQGYCGLPAEPQTEDAMQLEPAQLKSRLDNGDDLFLLDVRELSEWEEHRIEGATLIPLGELPGRTEELDRDRAMVIYCRSGVRSMHALQFLRQQGFDKLENLQGGILAWERETQQD